MGYTIIFFSRSCPFQLALLCASRRSNSFKKHDDLQHFSNATSAELQRLCCILAKAVMLISCRRLRDEPLVAFDGRMPYK